MCVSESEWRVEVGGTDLKRVHGSVCIEQHHVFIDEVVLGEHEGPLGAQHAMQRHHHTRPEAVVR